MIRLFCWSMLWHGVLSAAMGDHGGIDSQYLQRQGDILILSNDHLARYVRLHDGVWQTVALHNRRTGHKRQVESPEFVLHLEDRPLSSADFRMTGLTQPPPDAAGRLRWTVQLAAPEAGLEAELLLTLHPDQFWMTKQLRLRATGAARPLLKSVDVEHFTSRARPDRGGFGQPVFLDGSFFFGLEYPAGYNVVQERTVFLRHHPGVRLGPEWWASRVAVLGAADRAGVERAFRTYIESFRRRPRSFTVYNSWYDVRYPELTTEVLLGRAEELRKGITERTGLALDSVVVDDGWQNKQSIWETHPTELPQGFGPLAEALEARGTHLGLWLPVTPVHGNLDTEWGAAQGYEVSSGHFCLAGEKFRTALKAVLARYVTENHVNYFKHDFNVFDCDAANHGHLPGPPFGFEAGVNGVLEVYEFMSQLNPDLYLNPSGGMWLSPWWLRYVDTVWMRYCGDHGWNDTVPAWELRDQALTYRDSMLYRNLHGDRVQFPASAIMTIGFIDGLQVRLGGPDEPLDRWADDVIVNMGRGSMLKELYVTPGLFSDAQWDVLAGALKWATEEQEVLAQSRMLPGDPAKGEVYGYTSWRDGRGYACLRNPAFMAQEATLDLDEMADGDAGPFVVQSLYPFREVHTRQARGSFRLSLGPYQTLLLAVTSTRPLPEPALDGGRYRIAAREGNRVTYHLWGEPGGRVRVSFTPPAPPSQGGDGAVKAARIDGDEVGPGPLSVAFPGRPAVPRVRTMRVTEQGTAAQTILDLPDTGQHILLILAETPPGAPTLAPDEPFTTVTVNGTDTPPLVNNGPGWRLYRVPLSAGRQDVTWPLAPAAVQEPFRLREYTWSVWLYSEQTLAQRELVVDYASLPPEERERGERGERGEGKGKGAAVDALVPTPRPGLSRTTREIQARRLWRRPPAAQATLELRDLSHLRAAKLRVRVFGVQGLGEETITLNGVSLGRLPTNSDTQQPDVWEERILDLTPEQLAAVREMNEVAVTNVTPRDCLKFGFWTLAVQREDGTWVESNTDDMIYCNTPSWLYAEGTLFTAGTSPVATLPLPVARPAGGQK